MVIQSMGEFKTSKTVSFIRIIVINIVVLCLILFIIEGISSYVLMAHDVVKHRRLAEQRHTQSLPYEDTADMFIPEGQINYLNAGDHLNNRGNEFVARVIYEERKKSGNFQKTF